MFNHFVNDPESGALILFNSYLGARSIMKVPQLKKDKIKKWLIFSLKYHIIILTGLPTPLT